MEEYTPDFSQNQPEQNDQMVIEYNNKKYNISRSEYSNAIEEGRSFAYIVNNTIYFLNEVDFNQKKLEQEELAKNQAIYRKYINENNKNNMRNFYRTKR